MSKERVLTLLYEKTFPHQAQVLLCLFDLIFLTPSKQLAGIDAGMVGEDVPVAFGDDGAGGGGGASGQYPGGEDFDTGKFWNKWLVSRMQY